VGVGQLGAEAQVLFVIPYFLLADFFDHENGGADWARICVTEATVF
jgi:hypothetical protein